MKNFILSMFPRQKSKILAMKREYIGIKANFKLITLKILRKEKLVTILGCCRQDSVSNIFMESQIRNDLTYTHSTKEVIQAISYLNESSFEDFSNFSFRTAQIAGRFTKRKRLMRQWRMTDVVVIEISSLKYYLRNGVVYHHEAYDNPKGLAQTCKNYLYDNPNKITEHRISETELLEDLNEIVEKIGDKKIIFTTNFITRPSGTRQVIHSVLKKFCEKRNFQFVDTHHIFDFWRVQDILIEEPVLAHLTKLGHEIMANRYQQAIMNSLESNSAIKVLAAKYVSYPRYQQIYGLGDYLYGVMHLFQLTILDPQKLVLKVDYSQSSIAPFLREMTSPILQEPKYLFHEATDQEILRENVVFTNKRPTKPITPACRDFVLRNSLPLNEEFSLKANQFLKDLGLLKDQYTVLHVRMGDSGLLDVQDPRRISITRVADEVKQVISNFEATRKYVVVVDSLELRNLLSESGLKVTQGSIAHTGFSLNKEDSIENTLKEFYLLMHSEKIIQFSTLSWGSGFSETSAILAGVPLDKINLS